MSSPEYSLRSGAIALLITTILAAGAAAATKFDLDSMPLDRLKLLGDAHLRNGSIQLTRELPVPNSGAGRALYAKPVHAPFSTFFSFIVTNLNPSSIGGGLAFVLSLDGSSLGDSGGFLGVLNASGNSSPVVAVEFDTRMDDEFNDINGNHVGIDEGSMVSSRAVDLGAAAAAGVELKSGRLVHSWVELDVAGELRVFVSHSAARRPAEPVIAITVDLSGFAGGFMFVGFSGSTQGSTETHSIEWWSFSSGAAAAAAPPSSPVNSNTSSPSLAPSMPFSIPKNESNVGNSMISSSSSSSSCRNNSLCRKGTAAVAATATAAFVVASIAGLGFWVLVRRSNSHRKWENLISTSEIVNSPREFSYKELCLATRSFEPSRIIGHGAFGTVYKGIVPETGAIIAVKRCTYNGGGGGRSEFLSELAIIAVLRHRNLVRLQGWCHEKGREILLVYDYMANGSLDRALYDAGAPPLPWRRRCEILSGVASALAYLHRGCERQVIHRDVKSSNVLLDGGFAARLGDFGLARQVDHGASPDAAAAAGTMGYLAPEYLLTGRATERTDAFSFGVLVLEVVTGRRPIDGGGEGRNLVEWAWRLHGEGRDLDAVDGRLAGEFDGEEARRAILVGLACSSPDPEARPGMPAAVQMLAGDAPPPSVPTAKPPAMGFASTNQEMLLLSLEEDSLSDYHAVVFNLSSSSSSSSSPIMAAPPSPPGDGGEGFTEFRCNK